MKPTLLALPLLLASVLSPCAQTNQPTTNTTTSTPVTNSAAQSAVQTNQASSIEIDALLKYQEFLRIESDHSAEQLTDLIQHTKDWISLVGWCACALAAGVAAVLTFLGFTSSAALKGQASEQLRDAVMDVREKMQEASQEAFDTRLKLIDSAYSRRQAKYLKLLRSFFEKLFSTNPTLVNRLIGSSLTNSCLKGRRALWVEDDGVGIALLVELLETHSGLEIEIAESTEKALAETLTHYDLVISNLRRDPHDDAGIRLTEAIRNNRRSAIPIIIFTRAGNATLYGDAIRAAGATAIATNHDELLSEVAKCLQPKSPASKTV